jgi:acyl-CoA reductase-like NAD-dependent aldehyde dehydrogenase/phytoene dehydrogenase-like protein
VSRRDEAVVIGSGPNGLSAAITLAEAGRDVTVLEAFERPGGAVATEELTLPGFHHDVHSAVYPAAAASPVFARWPLEAHGLRWVHPDACVAHVIGDDRAAVLYRSLEQTVDSLDAVHPGDGLRWAAFAQPYLEHFGAVRRTLLSGFPPVRGPVGLLRGLGLTGTLEFARLLLAPAMSLADELFDGPGSKAWLYGSAMHGDVPPTGAGSAIAGAYLQILGHAVGWPSPEGGAGRLAAALVGHLESLGGRLRTSAPVTRVVVERGRVTGVEVGGGEPVRASIVVADTTPGALVKLAGPALESGYARRLRRFRHGAGTIKVDWAMSAPIPWSAPEARRAGTVHVGGSDADVLQATAYAGDDELAEKPFLLTGQQSVTTRRARPGASTRRGRTPTARTGSTGARRPIATWSGWRPGSRRSPPASATRSSPGTSRPPASSRAATRTSSTGTSAAAPTRSTRSSSGPCRRWPRTGPRCGGSTSGARRRSQAGPSTGCPATPPPGSRWRRRGYRGVSLLRWPRSTSSPRTTGRPRRRRASPSRTRRRARSSGRSRSSRPRRSRRWWPAPARRRRAGRRSASRAGAALLRRAQKWVTDNSEVLANTIVAETGKTHEDAQLAEIAYAANAFGFWAKHAPEYLADEKVRSSNLFVAGRKLVVRYAPLGVVGIIGPWNYPLTNSFGDAIPALAAGNAVVLKPSEITPLTSLLMAECMRECGLPTASTRWRRARGDGRRADRRGGHDHVHRLDADRQEGHGARGEDADARLARARRQGPDDRPLRRRRGSRANAAVFYSMQNGGQTCISIERVYVEAPVYDEFVAKVAEKARRLRQGDPTGPGVIDVGAVTFPPQVDIVSGHVEEAREAGATVLVGGQGRGGEGQGRFYSPTVLTGVDHTMAAMTEETFGPTLPIMKVADAEEAIRLANDSPYGLGASVFGRDVARATAVARRIEAGGVCVNDAQLNYLALELPMGGWKASGLGSRHGAGGIRKYTRSQSLLVTRFAPKRDVHMYPYRPMTTKLLGRLVKLLYGRGSRD